jgi:hypothetical protein
MPAPMSSRPPRSSSPQLILAATAVALCALLLFVLAVWVLQEHRSASLLLALDDPWQALRPLPAVPTAPAAH